MQRHQINSSKENSKRLSVIVEGENDENSIVKASTNDKETKMTNKIQLKRHAIIFHCEFSSERGPTM